VTYINATTIAQALGALREQKGKARVIAGGTDLYLQQLPEILVDISGIDKMRQIQITGEILELGSGITHAQTFASSLLQERATCLSEACSYVGSPQIRNLGTLGGNVVNAAPAADAAVGLVTMDARAILVDCEGGNKEAPLEELYQGYNRTTLDNSREILMALKFTVHHPGEGSSYQRFSSRKSLSLPIVSVGAWAKVKDKQISGVRLVAAPLNPSPTRLRRVEKELEGAFASPETYRKAGELAREEAVTRDSPLRGSGEYRRHLVGVGVERALREAVYRAMGIPSEEKAGDYYQ